MKQKGVQSKDRKDGSEQSLMKAEEEEGRIAEEGGKATREVTSAVNNLSFKNQSEALIGAVA